MVDKCSLCERPTESASEYCTLHADALRNIERQYVNWCNAFGGNLSNDVYLSKLRGLNETGSAVKALIDRIQRSPGTT